MYSNPEQKSIQDVYNRLKELEPSVAPDSHETFLDTIEDMVRRDGEGSKLGRRTDIFNDAMRFEFLSKFLNDKCIRERNYIELMRMAGGSEWNEWMENYFPYQSRR